MRKLCLVRKYTAIDDATSVMTELLVMLVMLVSQAHSAHSLPVRFPLGLCFDFGAAWRAM